MNQTVFERELQKSIAATEGVFASGGVQFDGDPHWNNAMKALAEAAIADAEKIKNGIPEAGTAG